VRVLHVYKDYFPESQGGLEEAIRQICLATGSRGIDNEVFTLAPVRKQEVLARDEAKVTRFRQDGEIASCGLSVAGFLGFRQLAAAADVVHYHFPWPFADLMHLVHRVRTPSLVTYHSDVVRQRTLMRIYAPLMRRFFASVDAIVTTSPNYFASSKVLQAFSEKVEIVPLGLGADTFPALRPDVHQRLEQALGRGFFLFVGVLRYYKGLHILLDAVAGTALPVVIAGAGPVEPELKAHVERLGINNVHFLGRVSEAEKVALYDLARAVVFPSQLRSEAFGVTLIEGAMFGKPLISTEIGTGTSYVNVDGETGKVVPPGDSKDLRAAMLALASDDHTAAAMGRAARARYEQLFTAEVMGDQYADLYRRLAGPDG